MRKEHLVTVKQAKELAKLGFNDRVSHYGWDYGEDNPIICEDMSADWNNSSNKMFFSIPTVDEAIDWIHRKTFITIDVNVFNVFGINNANCYMWCFDELGEIIQDSEKTEGKTIYSAKRKIITKAIAYMKNGK